MESVKRTKQFGVSKTTSLHTGSNVMTKNNAYAVQVIGIPDNRRYVCNLT